MGAEVERWAPEAGHEIAARLGRGSNLEEALGGADVAIDFSAAEAVSTHVRAAVEAEVPIVVGTTGWYAELDAVRRLVEEGEGALVYGANFSIGANLFLHLAETAARLLDPFPDYDPFVVERHHRGKKDAPSGTAHVLAERLIGRLKRKSRIQAGNPEGAIAPEALHVVSVRAGEAFGHHEVSFDGASDTVTIAHTARSREGFARGAVYAAEWIRGKKGFFEFSSTLSLE